MPKATAPFPWPGSKGGLADWILDVFPHHETYVDVFGGSGAMLFEKPRAAAELYNDGNRDLVQFMRTLKNQPDELIERLRLVPYARELHDKWTGRFFEGHRPDDTIERAARYYFIRRAQYGGEAAKMVGFRATVDGRRNPARQWQNSIPRLSEFADRLCDVKLERQDYADLLSHIDLDSKTLLYCDPPYRDTTDRYQLQPNGNSSHGSRCPSFDFETFAKTLRTLASKTEAYIVMSTDVVPEELDGLHRVSKASSHSMNATNGTKPTTEYLLTNFDPETISAHTGNATLTGF